MPKEDRDIMFNCRCGNLMEGNIFVGTFDVVKSKADRKFWSASYEDSESGVGTLSS